MSEISEKKRKQLKIKKQCSSCSCVPKAKKRKGGTDEVSETDVYIKTSMVKENLKRSIDAYVSIFKI